MHSSKSSIKALEIQQNMFLIGFVVMPSKNILLKVVEKHASDKKKVFLWDQNPGFFKKHTNSTLKVYYEKN